MTDAVDNRPEATQNPPDADPTNDKPANGKPKKKMSPRAKLVLRSLLVVVLIVIVAWFIYYELRGKYLESTNDAFVYADSVTVAPKVSGYVEQVFVVDNQDVKAGQPLVRIDARDYAAQSSQSKAQIDAATASEDAAKAQLQEQKAAISQAQAQLSSAEEDARFAASEVERYTPLAAARRWKQHDCGCIRSRRRCARHEPRARRRGRNSTPPTSISDPPRSLPAWPAASATSRCASVSSCRPARA